MTINREQREFVWERANNCCEYCRFPHQSGTLSFHVDHIIPLKHGGADDTDNLCLACYKCNGYKDSDVAGFDPETGELTRFYNPRTQDWDSHFEIMPDMVIKGLTTEGRTTVQIFRLNEEGRVQNRQVFAELGDYPCEQT